MRGHACARRGACGHARHARCQLDARGRLAVTIVAVVPSWSWPGSGHRRGRGRGRGRGCYTRGHARGQLDARGRLAAMFVVVVCAWVVGIRSSKWPRSRYVSIGHGHGRGRSQWSEGALGWWWFVVKKQSTVEFEIVSQGRLCSVAEHTSNMLT